MHPRHTTIKTRTRDEREKAREMKERTQERRTVDDVGGSARLARARDLACRPVAVRSEELGDEADDGAGPQAEEHAAVDVGRSHSVLDTLDGHHVGQTQGKRGRVGVRTRRRSGARGREGGGREKEMQGKRGGGKERKEEDERGERRNEGGSKGTTEGGTGNKRGKLGREGRSTEMYILSGRKPSATGYMTPVMMTAVPKSWILSTVSMSASLRTGMTSVATKCITRHTQMPIDEM
eukprot:3933244-Rhodomonas_salina.2